MFQLGWFRKSVLVVLIVALTTTLPLPLLDRLFSPYSIYAASDGQYEQSTAYTSPLSEALSTTNGLTDVLPPEMANTLPGMSLFGAGEPEGVLMDVGAIEAALNSAPDSPDSLANPISISRAQSAYQPGAAIDNQLTITFTVTNNRPPAIVPQVPVSATITDSIAIMSEFDYANDPNTMRNVMVVDALTDQATYLASSPLPDQDGATNAWNLGDIAPLSSTSFTVTLQVPASVADFTTLDTGATAWGTLQGRQVTAQSSAATLTPETINGEPIGDWLKWTVDADIYDEYMLEKAAEIGQAPETLFTYVRSLGYESYSGSLRGTRGTIWSEAGNSLDQASLLIAMLRTSGIPARYRHGKLELEPTQELILSMFPEPTRVIGHIPEGIEVADPANDTQLLAETEDHWWVEAYLPNQGWTDLDPSFPNAAIGERFVTDGNIATDGTDQIAEVPDNVRHKVTLKLKVEEYNPLNTGGTLIPSLEHSYPLTHTFNTVELVGNPVTLGHLVNSAAAGGFLGTTIRHTYVPYFLVGDEPIEGNAYQDLLSNIFGSLSWAHTAVWLIFETQDAAGNVETYEREIVDLIGFESRQPGGTINPQFPEDNSPIFGPLDVYTTSFLPNSVPNSSLQDALGDIASSIEQLNEDVSALQEFDAGGDLSADQEAELRSIMYRFEIGMGNLLGHIGLNFAVLADQNLDDLEEGLLVNSYYDAPRIITYGMNADMETGMMSFAADLRKTTARTIPYPGQIKEAIYSVNLIKGIVESSLEGDVLSSTIRQPATTAARVFEAADDQNIDVLRLDSTMLGLLDELDISAKAKAHIKEALQEGKLVTIPQQAVTLDGISTIGWWETEPNTGETIGVMENGLHNAFIEDIIIKGVEGASSVLVSGLQGFSAYAFAFLRAVFEELNTGRSLNLKEALKKADEIIYWVNLFASALSCAAAVLSITDILQYTDCFLGLDNKDPFSLGTELAKSYIKERLNIDPPLADALLASPVANRSQVVASTTMVVTANTSGPTLSASLTSPSTAISSSIGSTTFYASALSGMGFGGDGTAYGAENYADSAVFQAQGANLMIGAPAGGMLQVGGESVSVPNGVAIAGYGAQVSIAEASGAMDQVTLAEGEADFFTLDLSSDESATNPVSSVNFQANISANFDDTYTMTVEAPDGWHVEIDTTGVITATPPLGAAEADYTLLVVAQSGSYPDLFASALHTVTVGAYEGMEMSVNPDLLITIPWGPSDPNAIAGDTNNGQMQITGAAFTVDITNTSNIAHEFTLDVAGLPEGWLVLSGEEGQTETSLTLPAGEIGQVGLYISPTLTTLPAVGTEFPFTVNAVATANAALSASDGEIFIVPGIAFSQVEASPLELYSSLGSSTTFDVSVRNVGNITGSFPLSVTRPLSTTWTAQYNEPLSLAAGEANTQTVTLLTPDGEVGDDYVVSVLSPSGAYTQTANVVVHLVGTHAKCAYDAAQQVVTLDNALLTAAVQKLAGKMSLLESDLADLTARNEVVAAIEEVIRQEGNYLTLPAVASLRDVSQVMPTHTEAADLSNDLAALCDALSNLSPELQAVAQHGISARFVPALNAALPNQTIPYTLTLTNQGTEQTDYTLTITSPLIAPINQTISLAPAEVAEVPISLTPTELGTYEIEASIEAVGEPLIQANPKASLNVVDAFVQLLQVEAEPPFVETGTSSTTLSIDVANIANIYLPATASMEILAPDGSQQWSDQMPLGVRTGDSRTYTLSEVNTSGWESGTYTVTVDLLDDTNSLIPNGTGYTYLLVGQGLEAEVAVKPTLVAPGTVTVTTFITTTIHDDLLPTQSARVEQGLGENKGLGAWGEKEGEDGGVEQGLGEKGAQISFARQESPESESAAPKEPASAGFVYQPPISIGGSDGEPFTPSRMSNATGIVRHEEEDAGISYSGNWSPISSGSARRASGGQYMRSNTAGDTASYTFTGSWVALGFATSDLNGEVGVSIDGTPQPTIDTYSRYDDVASVYYNGLSAGSHTITLTVLGTSNPNASNNYVELDYIDVWDGTDMADGTFEHDSRVYLSGNWQERQDTIASDGSYIRRDLSVYPVNAWFPFTGDSISFQAIAGTDGDEIEILIDGQKIDRFDLYHTSTITRTFSFNDLGAGPHVLQINSYRGSATVDTFTTPGSAPFYVPPVQTGIIRYEEDDPALLYNGEPFTQTAQTWNMIGSSSVSSRASEGYAASSRTADDTVSLTFTGTWVGVGLLTSDLGGEAEIFIDDMSRGVIDTYSHEDDVLTLYYDGLTAGSHTISVTVLGTSHPNSRDKYVRLDHIDVWDGTDMADGTFEHDSGRVYLSRNWEVRQDTIASDGSYIRRDLSIYPVNAWFPFTGDSVTFQGIADTDGDEIEILIDGQKIDRFDLYHSSSTTRTFSFNGLGAGPHVLQINYYRGQATVDTFTTPGSAPFYEPPVQTGIIRYEEDDPALLYNGEPFTQTARTWNMKDYDWVSEGYAAWSVTADDRISLTFTGTWVGVGFLTNENGGEAEIFIDSVSQGVVDTYSHEDDVLTLYYDGLTAEPHTISVTVLGTSHPYSQDKYVRLDYIDVWDGTVMPDGTFEEDDQRVYLSHNWEVHEDTIASGGSYIRRDLSTYPANAWFPFTGDSITFQGIAYSGGGQVQILLDGQLKGFLDLSNDTTITRTFSFANQTPGPHILQVSTYEGTSTVDAFVVPGVPPFQPATLPELASKNIYGRSGTTITPIWPLKNSGIEADSFTLTISGNNWPTTVPNVIGPLAPTTSQNITVSVSIPSDAPAGSSDNVTITVTSISDPNISASAVLTTFVGAIDVQLCIALDASGSINSEQFDLMKNGLAAAIRDETVMPRDGSIELSVIQFASTTSVELPTTIIDNATTAEAVATQIEAITRISGGTGTYLAIDECTSIMTNSPYFTAANQQVINLVTDGEPTIGDPDGPTAAIVSRDNAVAAGIDNLNAEAIGVEDDALAYLRDELVYPQPGYEAPPFLTDQGGFVIRVNTFEDFADSIKQKMQFVLNRATRINVTHTIPITDVNLLPDTITPLAEQIINNPTDTQIAWQYTQSSSQPSQMLMLQTSLPNMQPGEVRQISQGTQIDYELTSGTNHLTLPPLYVAAAHIIAIEPVSQTTTTGSRAIYDVTFKNPSSTSATYSLAVNGLPEGWANLPTTISLSPESESTLPMTITVPTGAELAQYDFSVTVDNGIGGQDQAGASLIVANLLDITVDPEADFVLAGEVVTYTVTVTNAESVERTYALTHTGLEGNVVTLPDTVTIAANSAITTPLVIEAYAKRDIYLFSVQATTIETQASSHARRDAILELLNDWQVAAALNPTEASGGPGTTVPYTLTVTNTGSLSDTYDLAIDLPAGWTASFNANGTEVTHLSLTPYVFNSANFTLLVTPPTSATPGSYDFTVTVQSRNNPDSQASVTGTTIVTEYGVQVAISPASLTLAPTETGSWDVTVTNTGTEDDTYSLIPTGIVAGSAQFSSETVSVAAGQSETVQLSADILEFALERSYDFQVIARSTTHDYIQNQDSATIGFTGYEAVEVGWRPTTQTVTDSLSAAYMLVITNTGNLSTYYQLSLNAPELTTELEVNEVYIPPHMAAGILVTAQAPNEGTYTIEGIATSRNNDATDNATATLIIPFAAGITITPTALTVSEDGLTDTYQLSLISQPTDTVSITINSDNQTTISPSTLTFEITNWQTPQTVTVSAIDDTLIEGTHTSTISHTVNSADTNYNNFIVQNVSATITDNDTQTATSTPTATNTPIASPTVSNTPIASPTVSNTPIASPTATNTPIASATVTNTPIASATVTNTPIASATATTTPTLYEAVEVAWLPASQVMTDSYQTSYMLVITNTGNLKTRYQLSANISLITQVPPELDQLLYLPLLMRESRTSRMINMASGPEQRLYLPLITGTGSTPQPTPTPTSNPSIELEVDFVSIPPNSHIEIPAMVYTHHNGDYRIEAQAASQSSNVSASDMAELTIQNKPQLSHKIMLPIMLK